MRRLVLLCLAAAASGYNLVLQEFTLTGGLVTNEIVRCGDNSIEQLHVDGKSYTFDCYNGTSPTDDTIDSIHIMYKGPTLKSKAKKINCDITTSDGDVIEFTLQPDMNTGKMLTSPSITGKYTPVASPSTTTAAPPAPKCDDDTKLDGACEQCKDPTTKGCPCALDPNGDGCPNTVIAGSGAKLLVKPKKIIKPEPAAAAPKLALPDYAAAAAFVDSELPAAIRFRGPGPVIRPSLIIRDSPEDTVVAEEEEEERRVRRAADDAPPKVDDTTVSVVVTYYVLDEPGNPAAVWAAVIEGIILLVLVGLCFWFFFWSPRARTAATTAADPYKDTPNYSVSYANSSYNNQNGQRIDAFQNQPAAPPRPANSAYMDDYITDNIGAMARPAAAAAAPTPAASAINPASAAFQPGHQRYDSSGLVTVNLS